MAYAAVAFRPVVERSLAEIRARLDTIPRASPGYDSLYRVFAARTDTLTRLVRERDEAQATLGRTRNSLGDRIDSLRAAMSRWQDSAYRDYESITKNLTSGLGREPVADSTGPDGRATLHLPVGDRGSTPVPGIRDPNASGTGTSGGVARADRASGRRTPRY
jgi:hypothetical protein